MEASVYAQTLDVGPGPDARKVIGPSGEMLAVPESWELLLPGDATLTRRVKKAGPSWTVKHRRGRKVFSRGVWAPAENIEAARESLEVERADPSYARRLAGDRVRRAKQQADYADEFEVAVLTFLAFAPRYAGLAERMAKAIADHAVPVGSGTVARTKRIPLERRAEAATIAWLRHQTTAYDSMSIPRVKGMRREVRRLLAERSRQLLARYRRGEVVDPGRCLLERGLAQTPRIDAEL
ncbi:DUF2293 domain-containing protein [Pseudenhygromyxa sp. WMMC2535]|uniref:DUF2293 domain-containing protein n=1 Tax=Pseudenhygromyxa sp. WMMC2535 TaxID=2712867 RepID=UPI001554E53C|nr:DUF2293 domain-containing protein [Pseudenhygromyxa sp. WMMC2535]NVB39348.1 DUF2293 domain-containing protein [Pseudenhygromyxa sp. WMMC2535]